MLCCFVFRVGVIAVPALPLLNRGTYESMIRAMGYSRRLLDAVAVYESLLTRAATARHHHAPSPSSTLSSDVLFEGALLDVNTNCFWTPSEGGLLSSASSAATSTLWTPTVEDGAGGGAVVGTWKGLQRTRHSMTPQLSTIAALDDSDLKPTVGTFNALILAYGLTGTVDT